MSISQERLKEVLIYNPSSGEFTWLKSISKAKHGMIAGSLQYSGYRFIQVDGVKYQAHRLAFLFMTGSFPISQIDHVDGVCSNNRWSNLRLATNAENQQNVRRRNDNKSGYIGVSWSRIDKKWRSRITSNGKQHWLGYFSSADEAYLAYLNAKANLHSFNPTPRPA